MSIEANTSSSSQFEETKYVLHRRFDRMGRLVGDETMKKLINTHVMVIGIGGVGSWASESLARSGIGKITLVDFDEICITNANRQLHALTGLVGKKKTEVMAERLRKINPQAKIVDLPVFYNAETSEEILAQKPDIIIDCIDNLTAKTHLLATCRERGITIFCSAGASARMDPLGIEVADLSKTHGDPFAHQIRKILRQKYNFPEKGDFGIPTVFTAETVIEPAELGYDDGKGFKCICPQGQDNPHSCDKRNVIYGNASFMTGSFGLILASLVVRKVAGVPVKGI